MCEPQLMLGATIKRYKLDKNTAPRLVFSMPMADLRSALKRSKVVGRHCQEEWRWAEGHKVHIKEFLGRVAEEKKWQRANR